MSNNVESSSESGDPRPDTSRGEHSVSEENSVSEEHGVSEEHSVTVRRSPRYFRLMIVGAGVGAVLAFVAAFAIQAPEGYTQNQIFGFLLLIGIVLGGALGAILALVLDRIVGRRSITVTANKLAVNDHAESEHVDPPTS